MKRIRVGIALVGVTSVMWIGSCQPGAGTGATSHEKGTTVSAGPRDPSMTRIWELTRQQQHRAVVEEVDRLVDKGAGPDTLGTALYLKADSLRQLGDHAQAEQLFGEVLTKYPNASWNDPTAGGNIRVAPLCEVGRALAAERDDSPFPEDSETYAALAWRYLNKGRFEMARTFAAASISTFQEIAQKQQDTYRRKYGSGAPKLSSNPQDNQEVLGQFWALFDVGTCHFIMGQAFQREADLLANSTEQAAPRRTLYDSAVQQYDTIIKSYSGAWAFDPSGPWYWSVLKAANDNRNLILLMQRRNTP